MLNHGTALTHCTLILATIQSKNQKWFKTTKQTSKYVTSNVVRFHDFRIYSKKQSLNIS